MEAKVKYVVCGREFASKAIALEYARRIWRETGIFVAVEVAK